MIYDGKEYEWVARHKAKVGDLVHITALDDEACDIHEFITWIDDEDDFHFDNNLPDGSHFVYKSDTFKTYRYVKDVEENSSFSVGDTVKVIGLSSLGRDDFIGYTGPIAMIYDDGDIMVQDFGEFTAILPPSSLELIEKPTQPITEALSEKVESNAITLDEAANNLVTSKAWTQSSEVKGKSPSILAGEAMKSFREAAVRAWAKPSEANVKEGDYMVITDNGYEGLAVGTLVKVLEPVGGDNDFWAENDEFLLYIDYADARFATTDEIAAINKPQLTFDRGDHVKILSDIAEGHADFSLDSVVTAQFRTDDGIMVQNLKGDVRKVIADEFLRKATPDEAIAAVSARYGHGKRTLKTQIDDFYDGMSALLVAKNENYGDSFSKQYDKYGMQGVEMRLNDKFMRLEQLIAGQPDKVGESVEDTLKDIIGYSTLALLKINENRSELSA